VLFTGEWKFDIGAYYSLLGAAVPDPQGYYYLAGFIQFEPWFRRIDGAFEIWLDRPSGKWRCAVNMDDSDNGYWYAPDWRHGPYIQGLNYTGTFMLRYYHPTPALPYITSVRQKGGGSSLRLQRDDRIPSDAAREIQLHEAMRSVATYWLDDMPAHLQAEWIRNEHVFDNQHDVEVSNQPYRRFYNVNVTLAQAPAPWIVDHTARTHYWLHAFEIVGTHIARQLITTSIEIYRTWPHPCYTLFLVYQYSPSATAGRLSSRYTRLLGTWQAFTDAFIPDHEQFIHDWPAAYPLVPGKQTQILLRSVNDFDYGAAPNNWCPHTLTDLSNVWDIQADP